MRGVKDVRGGAWAGGDELETESSHTDPTHPEAQYYIATMITVYSTITLLQACVFHIWLSHQRNRQ